MTRKLRNSLTALLLAAAACAVGAVATAAMPLDVYAASPAQHAAPDAKAPAHRSGGSSTRRMRASAGMPYFSFVPRG